MQKKAFRCRRGRFVAEKGVSLQQGLIRCKGGLCATNATNISNHIPVNRLRRTVSLQANKPATKLLACVARALFSLALAAIFTIFTIELFFPVCRPRRSRQQPACVSAFPKSGKSSPIRPGCRAFCGPRVRSGEARQARARGPHHPRCLSRLLLARCLPGWRYGGNALDECAAPGPGSPPRCAAGGAARRSSGDRSAHALRHRRWLPDRLRPGL